MYFLEGRLQRPSKRLQKVRKVQKDYFVSRNIFVKTLDFMMSKNISDFDYAYILVNKLYEGPKSKKIFKILYTYN